MNQRARAQIELIKKNIEQHESRDKHKELTSGLCEICHQENLEGECPLLEYMMEDLDNAMSGLTITESIDRIMMNRLKTNINNN